MIAPLMFAAATQFTTSTYPQGFVNLTPQVAQESALSHSPEVQGASARVHEMQAALAVARGIIGPSAYANYTQAPQAGAAGETITQRFSTIGLQTTSGDLLAYSPGVRLAQFNLQSAQADLLAAQAAERMKAIAFFYDALRGWANLKARENALAVAQADERAASLRYFAGDAPRLDVLRADVAVDQARADLATAQAGQANAYEALSVETTIVPGQIAFADVVTIQPGIAPRDAVGRALLMRPEVASARAAVDAQISALRAAQRGIFPTVSVQGGYTRGTDTGQRVAGPSANIQMSLPLSNSGAARVNIERAKLEQAQAHLESVNRKVSIEVAAATRTYDADHVAALAARQARLQAEATLKATQTGYRSGASSSLDVTAARQTYEQSLLAELNAYYAELQARATLRLLMGS
ncbi:MAG: hypothetical protein DLM50_03580 [Candidatus Meridianibacter frigidus]|nr:MAG: hypothetical protein DLM50_03580 [Candidatus Eremiobacteraeota bacterium]